MSLGVPVGRPLGRPAALLGRLPRRQLNLLLLALLLSAIAGYFAYQRFVAAARSTPALQTVQARDGSLVTTVSATGNVVAAREAKLSFPVSGKLTELDVNIGDSVKAGQVLARIDPQPFQIKVDAAQSVLNTAKIKLQQLQDGATPEERAAAQAAYDAAVAKLNDVAAGTTPADMAAAGAAVDQAKASLTAAQAAVDQAQANLNASQAKLDYLKQGAQPADVASTQSSVDQAQATLTAAQAKLNQLSAGPTATDLQAAKSGVASAKSDLATKANPPQETDVALAQEDVNQAQTSLDQAKLDLANATLTAPFDGLVAATGPNVGEQTGSQIAVTLVDPKSVRIDATVDESDVAKLAVGQPATVTFDALPDYQLQGKVIAIAPAGTTTQGVVSYLASVGITNPDRPLPAGMSASISVETSRKDNVLLVPNRAIRTQGTNKMVEVISGNKTEMKQVQTGASNDQMTEIVSGLKQGEQVVIPSTTTRAPTFNVGGAGLGGPGGFRPGGR